MIVQGTIEVDDEHLKVLMDYRNGYTLDSEYFELNDKQEIEREMNWDCGLLEGGFYQHYPLSPTLLGRIIIDFHTKQKYEI